MKAKFALVEGKISPSPNIPVDDANWDAVIAARLRDAVRKAGGNKVVSEASGVPLKTLSGYLAGKALKLGTLLALAEVCDISLEQLVYGRTPDAPTAPVEPIEPALFSFVDMDLLAEAIAGANAAFTARGAAPGGRDHARVVAILYDEARRRLTSKQDKA